MPQPCYSTLVFLHISNFSCRYSFASPPPLANTRFVTCAGLLGQPPVFKLTTIKSYHGLITLPKHCRHYGLTSITDYDLSIYQCSFLETNRLHITAMVLSGFPPAHRPSLHFHQSWYNSIADIFQIHRLFVDDLNWCQIHHLRDDPKLDIGTNACDDLIVSWLIRRNSNILSRYITNVTFTSMSRWPFQL